MGRATKKSCKLCRREGEKLFLKGERCFTSKCSFGKRSYPPGGGARRPRKVSEYGIRLREKQKARRIYGLNEIQFKKYFSLARRADGITGENLLVFLEKRLDNVVFRLNIASSRIQARQLVTHGHFLLNGRKCNIPSLQVKVGDQVTVRETSRERFKDLAETVKDKQAPGWLNLDVQNLTGKVMSAVTRDQIDTPLEERLIVEHYSR